MHAESGNVDTTLNVPVVHEHHPFRMTKMMWAAAILGGFAIILLIQSAVAGQAAHGAHEHPPSIWSIIPFAAVLMCIAILPLSERTRHWWESNMNRLLVSLICGTATLLYYLFAYDLAKVVTVLEEAIVVEYTPFIVLLFALFVISGGICLKGDLAARPTTNTAFLAIGALLASLIGTTGASMLLIRPLIRTNSERKHVTHTVIFFIFLVSNIGGCLLPIGDPPLFLGYLKGVPFLWTLKMWMPWAVMCALLLVVYFIWDTIAYRKETVRDIVRDETEITKLTLSGKFNFLLILGVVLCVAFVKPGEPVPGLGFNAFPMLRELVMLGLIIASLRLTSDQIRADNRFSYHAILEVAALFIGIFICMQAPIEILHAGAETLTPYVGTPFRLFWATGGLSSFLDNAPTYMVFFETAATMTPEPGTAMVELGAGRQISEPFLMGISLGAVFMGAMTYIGNGPNFMVRSIAVRRGVKMPSFFGYMLYSCGILVPIFLIATLLYF